MSCFTERSRSGRADLPAEILRDDDVGGLLRPGFGELDVALLEDELAAFVGDDGRPQLPVDFVERIDAVLREIAVEFEARYVASRSKGPADRFALASFQCAARAACRSPTFRTRRRIRPWTVVAGTVVVNSRRADPESCPPREAAHLRRNAGKDFADRLFDCRGTNMRLRLPGCQDGTTSYCGPILGRTPDIDKSLRYVLRFFHLPYFQSAPNAQGTDATSAQNADSFAPFCTPSRAVRWPAA